MAMYPSLPALVVPGILKILHSSSYQAHTASRHNADFFSDFMSDHYTLTVYRRGVVLKKDFPKYEFENENDDDCYKRLGKFIVHAKNQLAEWPQLTHRS